MPLYKIERWDAIMYKNNTFPLPVIRIKPDNLFYNYAKENNFIVLVTVLNSSSNYDGHSTTAVVEKTKCESDMFSLTLACGWLGYPPNNGEIVIQGLSGPDSITISQSRYVPPQPMNWPTGDPISWLKQYPTDWPVQEEYKPEKEILRKPDLHKLTQENYISEYNPIISFNILFLIGILSLIFIICIIK